MILMSDHGAVPELLPNLRDLGSMPVADGAVAPGRLLRSALPFADDRVPEQIVWPPRAVIDLRSSGELGGPHPLAASGAVVHHLPLLAALRPDGPVVTDLTTLYGVVLENAPHLLVDVVTTVASADGAALVHCAAGKDRTGVAVALVLRLLGAHRDDIVSDYLATVPHLEAIDARLTSLPNGHLRSHLPKAFFEVPEEAIVRVLDTWDTHDGGVHGWFAAAGGTSDDVESLRSRLVG